MSDDPRRKCLPERRRCFTQKVRIGGQGFYLNVGEYPNGTPGEVFFDVAKAGSSLRGFMGALAKVISLALQYGVPLYAVTGTLKELDFPPNGPVEGSVVVKEVKSIIDYVVQELEAAYPANIEPVKAAYDCLLSENEALRAEINRLHALIDESQNDAGDTKW